jgi:hypothetical protein
MNTTPHTSNMPVTSSVSTQAYPNTPKAADPIPGVIASMSENHNNNSELGTSDNHEISPLDGANEAYDAYGRRITSECEELRARLSQMATQLDASQGYTRTVEDDRDRLKDEKRNLESLLKDKETECAQLLKRKEEDRALINDLKWQVRQFKRRGEDDEDDMRDLESKLHRQRRITQDLRDESRSLMRVAQPVQLRAFRDYLVRQYGYTTGGFSATLASEKLAKVSKLSAYEIEDMFEYVYFRVLSLHFTNQSVGSRGQMATRWPIRCHVAH